jgi:EmrB/QacA subfamily drug resistance transporter
MDPTSEKTGRAWVLALASAASFMISLDSQVVTLALATIRRDLGASLGELEWIVNAYILSFAVLLLAGAALGDRYGRRRMFVAGLGLFAAASATCAAAPGASWLVAARALQGAGGALVMPLAMALLGAAFPRETRGRALGIFMGVTGLALIAGPVVGGAIAAGLAWQWIFWLNLPLAMILIPLVLARVPESFGRDTALDIPGVALVTAAVLGLVWGLMLRHPGALAGGAALLVAFVAWELRAREPMVPMRLFASRAFAAGNTSGFLMFGSLYGALFFMAQFLQTAQGHGPLAAGLRLLPWTATLFVVAPLAGALVNRVGERTLIAGGLGLQAAGLAWLALIASPELPYAALVPPLVLAGTGVSLALPAAQAVVLGAVAPAEVGKASGVFNMLRFLGGVFAVAATVLAFDTSGGLASAASFTSGFAAAIGVCAALSLAGAAAGLALAPKPVPSLGSAHV